MFEIIHELDVAALPDQVFTALTTSEGLSAWLAADATASGADVDGTVSFAFAGDDEPVTMRIDLIDAPDLAHWQCTAGPAEWVGTSVAWRIEGVDADDDGTLDGVCRVRFWHGGWEYQDGLLPTTSFEWAMRLDALRTHLAGTA
jgi:uncharacterized protein YndB with AHSA1/START domain